MIELDKVCTLREREREREVFKITHLLEKKNRCNDFKNAYRSYQKKKKKMLIGRICVCNEYYMLIYFIKIHSRW